MPFKKSFTVCAAALMLLSVGAINANASAGHRSNHVTKIAHHADNVSRAAHVKAVHARNLHRINRIKRHLLNHQKDLIKISKRINRARRHHHNASLITRLNTDKARLIRAVENNERGMVRLARTVASEEHQINLMRHPKARMIPQRIVNHPQVPSRNRQPMDNSSVTSTQDHQPNDYSAGKSVMTFISEVNGKLTRYVAKDSNFWNGMNQSKVNQYSDVDGRYSATPDQITQNEISQLNRQIQSQIQDSNNWMKDLNSEFNLI